VLKLAIVRVNETSGKQHILLSEPLAEILAEELRPLHLPGFRKRNIRRAIEALAAAESRLKQATIRLP
jgi:hypothetical protein